MPLEVGLSAALERTVEAGHLAKAFGSGDVDFLATPQVLAWCEQATLEALNGELGPGETSVGMRVRLDHISPTPLGTDVKVAAELRQIDGRRLTFQVNVSDDRGEIALGQVIRVIVDRDRFNQRA